MFCGKCGAKLDDGTRFCPECGCEVVSFIPTTVSEENAMQKEISDLNQSFEWKNGKEKKASPIVFGIIIAILATAIIALIAFFMFASNGKKLQKQLDLGQKYLDELDFDQALACYQSVIEIDPKNVDAYLGIIEIYIRQDMFEDALEWAHKGYDLTKDERLKEKIDMIEDRNSVAESDSEVDRLQEQLDLGQNYLSEQEYNQALDCFQTAMEMDSMCVDAYLGIVEVYIRQNMFEDALEWAHKGYDLTKDEKLKEKIDMLEGDKITDSLGNARKVCFYDGNGNLEYWHQYTYDKDGREMTMTHVMADGTELGTVNAEYDKDGNKTVHGCSSGSDIFLKTVNTYENGNAIKTERYSLDGELVDCASCEYDENGILTKECYYDIIDGKAELVSYRLFYYDDKGIVTKYEDYGSDGELWGYTIDEYDENGKCVRRTAYIPNGEKEPRVSYCQEYKYDENGEHMETIEYDGDGNVVLVVK